jgi:hypothetical protein
MTETYDLFWNPGKNARKYDEYARTTFSRVYPVIANQILERTGITRGTCPDKKSGPVLYTITMPYRAKVTIKSLTIYLFGKSLD